MTTQLDVTLSCPRGHGRFAYRTSMGWHWCRHCREHYSDTLQSFSDYWREQKGGAR